MTQEDDLELIRIHQEFLQRAWDATDPDDFKGEAIIKQLISEAKIAYANAKEAYSRQPPEPKDKFSDYASEIITRFFLARNNTEQYKEKLIEELVAKGMKLITKQE